METLKQWASQCDTKEQRVMVANKTDILVCLPFDILDLIFRYCSRCDLSRLCRTSRGLYFITIPSLYRRLEPVSFTDILRLKKALENGLGPTGIDNRLFAQEVVKSIHKIHLSCINRSTPRFLNLEDGPRRKREVTSYSDAEICQTVAEFTGQASNLRSFHLYELKCLIQSEQFWKAVSRPGLDELSVGLNGGWGCKAISSIKLLHNLKRLHISLAGYGPLYKDIIDVDAFELLLCTASQLQFLQLEFFDLKSHLGASRIRNCITRLSALRKLELRYCFCLGENVLELLYSLQDLERFIYPDIPSDRSSSVENLTLGSISSLKDVSTTSHYLLLSILKRSKVQTVRNVNCLPLAKDQSPSYLCKEFQNFVSIEQLELNLQCGTLDEEHRQDLIETLAYIPSSVKFLSFHSQSQRDQQIRLSHHKPELNCFRAIDHLVNLERLVLPRNCLFYQRQKQRQKSNFGPKQVGIRATIIALDLKAPKLEYVFFGDNLANYDDHLCRIDPIDAHRRYIVKLTRSSLKEPDQKSSSRSTVQKESNGFYSRLMHRKQDGVVVKAELVSAVCECESCFENQTRYDWEKLHQKYRF